MAVLQRFKDINRVMNDNFLKRKKDLFGGQPPAKEEYTSKMVLIMKEMQSPKKFNSPIKRRNLFV